METVKLQSKNLLPRQAGVWRIFTNKRPRIGSRHWTRTKTARSLGKNTSRMLKTEEVSNSALHVCVGLRKKALGGGGEGGQNPTDRTLKNVKPSCVLRQILLLKSKLNVYHFRFNWNSNHSWKLYKARIDKIARMKTNRTFEVSSLKG